MFRDKMEVLQWNYIAVFHKRFKSLSLDMTILIVMALVVKFSNSVKGFPFTNQTNAFAINADAPTL